jgi:transposase InsO family protein
MNGMINWKSITNQQWTDELYEYAVSKIKEENVNLPNILNDYEKRRLFHKRLQLYELQNGSLVLKVEKSQNRYNLANIMGGDIYYTVVKPSDIDNILESFLNNPKTTQISRDSLYNAIVRKGYLGISRKNVDNFLKKHNIISQVKSIHPKAITKSYRPRFPFEHWQMDLAVFDESFKIDNKGNIFILVIVDIFSKYVYINPLKSKSSAEIANILQSIFLRGDIPIKLHSDNGSEFKGEVSNVCEEFEVKQILNDKSYSPQTTGFAENVVKQTKKLIIAHLMAYKTKIFYDILERIAFSINNSVSSVTKLTPQQIHRGRDPIHKLSIYKEETPVVPLETDQQTFFKNSNQLYSNIVNAVSTRIHKIATKRESSQMQKEIAQNIQPGDFVQVTSQIKVGSQWQTLVLYVNNVLQDKTSTPDLKFNPFQTFTKKSIKKYYNQIFIVKELKRTSAYAQLHAVLDLPEKSNANIGYLISKRDFKLEYKFPLMYLLKSTANIEYKKRPKEGYLYINDSLQPPSISSGADWYNDRDIQQLSEVELEKIYALPNFHKKMKNQEIITIQSIIPKQHFKNTKDIPQALDSQNHFNFVKHTLKSKMERSYTFNSSAVYLIQNDETWIEIELKASYKQLLKTHYLHNNPQEEDTWWEGYWQFRYPDKIRKLINN